MPAVYDHDNERPWDAYEEWITCGALIPALPEQDWDTFVCLLDRTGPFNLHLDRLLATIPGVKSDA